MGVGVGHWKASVQPACCQSLPYLQLTHNPFSPFLGKPVPPPNYCSVETLNPLTLGLLALNNCWGKYGSGTHVVWS